LGGFDARAWAAVTTIFRTSPLWALFIARVRQ
jgi:hypothetical protein